MSPIARRSQEWFDRVVAEYGRLLNWVLDHQPLTLLVARATAQAIGDLIGELTDKDASYRRQVASTIVQLAGGEKAPYDPAGSDADLKKGQGDWSEWWKKAQTDLVFGEETRRQVEGLGSDATRTAAQAKLSALWPTRMIMPDMARPMDQENICRMAKKAISGRPSE